MNSTPLSLFLGLLAAALHGTAYVIYILQTKRGQSRLNPASWAIWAFIALLNALTFQEMTTFMMSLQFLVGSLDCFATFAFALFTGKYSRLSKREWTVLTLGIAGASVWWFSRNAALGNIVFLATFIISCEPTLRSVICDPSKEKATPWTLWTFAFTLTLLNVLINKGMGVSVITPSLLLVAHGMVAYRSRSARKDAMKPRDQMWEELTSVQLKIVEVEAENRYLRQLYEQVHAGPVDRGTIYEMRRNDERMNILDENEALIDQLKARESRLKQYLGRELP